MNDERHNYEVWTVETRKGWSDSNPTNFARLAMVTEAVAVEVLRDIAREDAGNLADEYEDNPSLLACGYLLYRMDRPEEYEAVAYVQIAAMRGEELDWPDCDKVEL